MTQYKVEKEIPPPAKTGRTKYPFPEMEVGDSFLAEKSLYKNIINAANSWGRYNGKKKFTVRTVPEGVRVWRVE